eukprot:GHUV01038257.1.p2 GENE.GHUV01038257.1~~GHUV01038257.1.p2  ORF type:complete len:113 (-),score=27.44 GHUV01038257.1:270-608(-)
MAALKHPEQHTQQPLQVAATQVQVSHHERAMFSTEKDAVSAFKMRPQMHGVVVRDYAASHSADNICCCYYTAQAVPPMQDTLACLAATNRSESRMACKNAHLAVKGVWPAAG